MRSKIEADPRFKPMVGNAFNRVTGSSSVDVGNILIWWIWRANEKGVQQANQELESFLDRKTNKVVVALWLFGPVVAKPIAMVRTIELVPVETMPFSFERENFASPFKTLPETFFPIPSSALIINIEAEKTIGLDGHSSKEVFDIQAKLTDIALLMNLIPTVSATSCYLSSYFADDTPPGGWGGGGGGVMIDDVVPKRRSNFPDNIGVDMQEIFDQFSSKDPKEKRRLSIALERLKWAKCRKNAKNNQALDIGIALESLLLSDLGPNEQISLALRLRGAWFAGDDKESRQYIAKTIKDAYDIRSDVVHSGSSSKFRGIEPYEDELAHHLRLLEKIATMRICKPSPVDWAGLLLGSV